MSNLENFLPRKIFDEVVNILDEGGEAVQFEHNFVRNGVFYELDADLDCDFGAFLHAAGFVDNGVLKYFKDPIKFCVASKKFDKTSDFHYEEFAELAKHGILNFETEYKESILVGFKGDDIFSDEITDEYIGFHPLGDHPIIIEDAVGGILYDESRHPMSYAEALEKIADINDRIAVLKAECKKIAEGVDADAKKLADAADSIHGAANELLAHVRLALKGRLVVGGDDDSQYTGQPVKDVILLQLNDIRKSSDDIRMLFR